MHLKTKFILLLCFVAAALPAFAQDNARARMRAAEKSIWLRAFPDYSRYGEPQGMIGTLEMGAFFGAPLLMEGASNYNYFGVRREELAIVARARLADTKPELERLLRDLESHAAQVDSIRSELLVIAKHEYEMRNERDITGHMYDAKNKRVVPYIIHGGNLNPPESVEAAKARLESDLRLSTMELDDALKRAKPAQLAMKQSVDALVEEVTTARKLTPELKEAIRRAKTRFGIQWGATLGWLALIIDGGMRMNGALESRAVGLLPIVSYTSTAIKVGVEKLVSDDDTREPAEAISGR